MTPAKHTVQKGETIPSIAAAYGFQDWNTIWSHPDNADLKDKRDPHILFEGDIVAIPEREQKIQDGATDQKHRFKTRFRKCYLVLRVVDYDGTPFRDEDFKLNAPGKVTEKTTDSEGWLKAEILPDTQEATLEIAGKKLFLKIGHLDPISEDKGQRQRLFNMGFLQTMEEEFAKMDMAIEDFQCEFKLKVDGILGPKTKAELEKQYGS